MKFKISKSGKPILGCYCCLNHRDNEERNLDQCAKCHGTGIFKKYIFKDNIKFERNAPMFEYNGFEFKMNLNLEEIREMNEFLKEEDFLL